MRTQEDLATLYLALSDKDKTDVASDLCDHLEGRYFAHVASNEDMTETHVLNALNNWAKSLARMGG